MKIIKSHLLLKPIVLQDLFSETSCNMGMTLFLQLGFLPCFLKNWLCMQKIV